MHICIFLYQMIDPVAKLLAIPTERIFANRLLFHAATGDFAGFDDKEYTSRSGGKATAIRALKVGGVNMCMLEP